MRGFLRCLCLLLLLLSQACNTGVELPVETPTATPRASPRPSLTATLPPSPLPPTLTPTRLPLTLTPTATPTEIPLIYSPQGNLIQPSSGSGEWLWYDSPHRVIALLFDGQSMWAGSLHGGLVQWNPQTLTAVRHTHATGFPLRTVNDLAFDAPSGFLYVAGDEGLAVWDGQRWQAFTSAQLGFLPDNPLRAVAVEAGTTIWVGADEVWNPAVYWEMADFIGGGLVRGDWQQGIWEQFRAPDPLISNQINDLAVDANGTLWVASGLEREPTPGGVSYRDAEGRWNPWGYRLGTDRQDFDDGLEGYAYYSLAISPQGRVYAGGWRGVSVLEPGEDIWHLVEIRDTGSLALDADDNLWIAASQALYRLNTGLDLERIYSRQESNGWQAVALDNSGIVWFGGPEGLFRLQGSRNVSQLFVPDALPELGVYSVAVNGDDTLWLRSGGLVSHLVGDHIFTYATESQAIEAAYPWTGRDSLWPVAPDGTLWLLEQDALRGYNASGWQSVALDLAGDAEHVASFIAGENGTLFVATFSAGLYIYTPGQGWSQQPYPQDAYYNRSLLYDARRNSLWVNLDQGFYWNGHVWQFDLGTREWLASVDDLGSIPQEGWWLGINLSPQGDLWAVSFAGNVKVHRDADNWEYITPPPEFPESFGFWAIYFGNSNDCWLPTIYECGLESLCQNGLVYYNGITWQWLTPENSSLASAWIYDLSVDSQGSAWLATGSGLQRVPLP